MFIKSTLFFVIAFFVSFTISPGHGADIIFSDGFEEGLPDPFVSEVTIGPQGGDFSLSNGINLSVQPVQYLKKRPSGSG